MLVCTLTLFAQRQTYSNLQAKVKFTYPSKFHKSKIQNASHMLLKLECDKTTLALSYWDYDLDSSYTIWDEDIVQFAKDNIRKTGTSLVSINKRFVNTSSGKKKCLVSIVNSIEYSIHMVTYQFLHNGNLYQIVISNSGMYRKGMLSVYDDYINGLYLK